MLNRGVVAGFDLEPHDFQSVQKSERLIDLGTGGVAIEEAGPILIAGCGDKLSASFSKKA